MLGKGFFVTGTDTDVGKTVASAALIRLLISKRMRVAGLKPIASGFEWVEGAWQNTDVNALIEAANVTLEVARVNRYHFKPPIAPHIAASDMGTVIDMAAINADLRFAQRLADVVVVEGVGGWLVPLSMPQAGQPASSIEGLALHLNLPVILVVGLRLGCLNHALLTARAIRGSGLPLVGWIANHLDADFARSADNIQALETMLDVPKLFELPYKPESPYTIDAVRCHDGWIAGISSS